MNEQKNTNEICPVCLDILDENSIATVCNHSFHYDCIFTWLLKHNTCPTCRNCIIEKYNDIITNINKNEYQIYLHDQKTDRFNLIDFKSLESSVKNFENINNIGYYDASDDESDNSRYVYIDGTIQTPKLVNKKHTNTYVEVIHNRSRGFWTEFKELFYCGLKIVFHS